ncbi:MAG: phenylalanine--tRNA ligase subunit beta [Proteobacteria bacterium]|nr:phenylalanine--tRNA ligase subunit beta [Pseudomonadota bacterium]
MKTSLSWLKEYVDVEMDASKIADALTMAGLEVETVIDRYAFLETVVVARILEIKPHKNADKLRVCTVDTGKDKLNIVCGAPNVQEGMLVPLALPGTELPGGVILEKGKIRGEVSEGMICSKKELAIGEDDGGIMVLEPHLTIGEPLNNALNLCDPVIEIDLTPNRPDCLGIIGIAREVAAFENKTVQKPETKLPNALNHIKNFTSVTIEDPDLCPRYAACLLTDIKVGPSPFWLKDRLQSVGLKPINNIVDVTNFVMMETGQPLHAFDFDNLAENRIVVKRAKNNKTFITLDEKERHLSADMLMICDGQKPVALAGVMGGLNSEIEEKTTRVLIESACFNPTSIRKTAKQLGLHSDASHRFERGVDPDGTVNAILRAAQLMAEIGGGQPVEGIIDEHPKPSSPHIITLGIPDTNRLIGTSLTKEKIESLLKSIGFITAPIDENAIAVTVPLFRVDVSKPVDLMEEVARCVGYNHIPTSFPLIPAKTGVHNPHIERRSTVKDILLGLGLTETVNYSFVHELSCDRLRLAENDPKRNRVKILNPLTEDQAVMRTSLLPGLLETARRNISRQVTSLKIFETGKIFMGKDAITQPDEIEMVTGLITGNRERMTWHADPQTVDFYDLKGILESLFESLHIENIYIKKCLSDQYPYTRPGVSATIHFENQFLGLLGEVHPEVLANYNLKQSAFIFEINLDSLLPLIPVIKSSADIPKYPAITRDITIIISKKSEAGQILKTIDNLNDKLVETVQLFDVYEGKPIPEGRRSISIRITYRSQDKTLKDKNINGIHQKITDTLLKEFDATLPV